MRLIQTRLWKDSPTLSLFGTLSVVGESTELLSCEREWKGNLPSVSCVPAGFYSLVPHDGRKYKRTVALVGETVDHGPGLRRSACVAHRAPQGRLLEGCFAWGDLLTWRTSGGFLTDDENKGRHLLERMRAMDEPHYITILDPLGICD